MGPNEWISHPNDVLTVVFCDLYLAFPVLVGVRGCLFGFHLLSFDLADCCALLLLFGALCAANMMVVDVYSYSKSPLSSSTHHLYLHTPIHARITCLCFVDTFHEQFKGNVALILLSSEGQDNHVMTGPMIPTSRLQRLPYVSQVPATSTAYSSHASTFVFLSP